MDAFQQKCCPRGAFTTDRFTRTRKPCESNWIEILILSINSLYNIQSHSYRRQSYPFNNIKHICPWNTLENNIYFYFYNKTRLLLGKSKKLSLHIRRLSDALHLAWLRRVLSYYIKMHSFVTADNKTFRNTLPSELRQTPWNITCQQTAHEFKNKKVAHICTLIYTSDVYIMMIYVHRYVHTCIEHSSEGVINFWQTSFFLHCGRVVWLPRNNKTLRLYFKRDDWLNLKTKASNFKNWWQKEGRWKFRNWISCQKWATGTVFV